MQREFSRSIFDFAAAVRPEGSLSHETLNPGMFAARMQAFGGGRVGKHLSLVGKDQSFAPELSERPIKQTWEGLHDESSLKLL